MRIFVLALILFPISVYAGWFGGSYDDCILDNMKGVTSNTAARAVQRACRNKYPKPKPTRSKSKYVAPVKPLPLPKTALLNLKGTYKAKGDNARYATVYNGNNNWSINSIIYILDGKKYKKNIFIDSLSQVEFLVHGYGQYFSSSKLPIVDAMGTNAKSIK